MRSVQRSGRGPALLNRNIWLVYIAYIAILWNLWFFSFWSVQIVKEAAQSSLLAAALTAAFNAGAGILGFPAGGWLADWAVRTGRSRKTLALVCTAVYSVLVLIFGWSVSGGGKPSLGAARAAAVHLRAVLQRAAADRAGHDRRHGAGQRARLRLRDAQPGLRDRRGRQPGGERRAARRHRQLGARASTSPPGS